MRMYDVIYKKRMNEELTNEEIYYFVDGFTKGEIPDYQASALLMAICNNGMTERETFTLTDAMLRSGDIIDLSRIQGVKVDKHSTGGVGDSTSLALAPILGSLGLKVAKMSGRGLGFSGGTLDKLESIPRFDISISEDRFVDTVNECGCAIIGQTKEVAPADGKIYALRDVTATIDKIPLIASSIMSKKLASGADVILLDVKFGSGAFMKTVDDAIELAKTMVKIGENAGKRVGACITSMEQPLGVFAGNSLEIINIIRLLHGEKSRLYEEVKEVCIKLLLLSKYANNENTAAKMVDYAIESGQAFNTFKKMVELQGGDVSYIDHPEKFVLGKIKTVKAKQDGYVSAINTENIGTAVVMLGGGRIKKTDSIDNSVGVCMKVSLGDYVKAGDPLVDMYFGEKGWDGALPYLETAFSITPDKKPVPPITAAYVDAKGVTRY